MKDPRAEALDRLAEWIRVSMAVDRPDDIRTPYDRLKAALSADAFRVGVNGQELLTTAQINLWRGHLRYTLETTAHDVLSDANPLAALEMMANKISNKMKNTKNTKTPRRKLRSER